jgi:1-deoxy-D-xylulose-5-phosphate reductoisomerase
MRGRIVPVTVKKVAVLGSTGSIGRQALEVIATNPERWSVVGLVAGSDADGLRRQVAATGARHSGLGAEAAMSVAAIDEVDIVLNAIVGAAGLRASAAALEAGKVLALANKESLVAAGRFCSEAAARGGGVIAPVDSEHAAIAQAMRGADPKLIRRIVLTASGGPFRKRRDLDGVTVEDALDPTWSMGPKITVDSATLMNKGLEVIEAHWLFGMSYDDIDVVVHPQSIVHGMVEFLDGSMIMQAAPADMRIPIQAALAHPETVQSGWKRVDLTRVGSLDFETADPGRWPCIELAYEAGKKGGSYPAVLNAANEEAVRAFLLGTIRFTDIARIVGDVLSLHKESEPEDIDGILAVDAWARAEARRIVRSHSRPRTALA